MQTEYQEQQTSTPEPTVIGPPASGSQLPFSALAKVKNIQAENIFIKASWVPKNVKFYNKRTPDEHVVIRHKARLWSLTKTTMASDTLLRPAQ
jgi:hypothetical protein